MSGPASACQVDALTTVSFEAHRLPLTISARHHSPTTMIDHTGSEKNTYNTFVERAIADDRRPPSPRIRTLDVLIAGLESRTTFAAARSLAAGPGDRPRRKFKR
jgi:hypothetical protein